MYDTEFAMILLGLVFLYSLIFIVSCFRIRKLDRFSKNWKHTKMFYYSILIQLLLRITAFSLTLWTFPTENPNNLFFLLLSLPDSFFLVSYLLLALQMLSIFYQSHMENQVYISLLFEFMKPRHIGETKVVAILVVIWIVAQSSLYTLFICEVISNDELTLEISLINVIAAAAMLLMMLIIFKKFMNIPLKSNPSWRRLSIMSRRLLLWTCGRFTKGAYDMFNYQHTSIGINNFFTHPKNMYQVMLIILSLFFTEIVCYISVVTYSFLGIFLFKEHEDNIKMHPYFNSLLFNPDTQNIVSAESPFIEPDKLDLEEILSCRENGLGAIYAGKYEDIEVAVRKIEFTRISDYILEDLKYDVSSIQELEIRCLLPLFGVHYTKSIVYIVMPFYEDGSLYDVLHIAQKVIDKDYVIKNLAYALRELHSYEIAHGHLNSHNVFIDKYRKIRIADLGLHKLKKYAGVALGYTNKSYWSSPERLKEASNVVQRVSIKDDIYAFGVIVWEIETGNIPNGSFDLHRVPKAGLISRCLNPTSAMTFDDICAYLDG